MSYSVTNQMANVGTDFPQIWVDNRRQFATNLINMEAMGTLSDMMPQTESHVVLMAARRMPRAIAVARLLNPALFSGASYYCDYAIEFISPDLHGADVTIVDDAINVGSTMFNIYDRVRACQPASITCYALARKSNGGEACKKNHLDVKYAFQKEWSAEEYKKFITGISKSLWILNLPLEVEFPVYCYNREREFLEGLPAMLEQKFPRGACHRQDIDESSMLGLHRCSIDLSTDLGINNKIRIYYDNAYGKLIVVPMAHCVPVKSDIRAWRMERFHASMLLMEDFKEILGLPRQQPDEEQARLLFGSAWDIVEKELNTVAIDVSKEDMTDFYKSIWPQFRDACIADWRRWSLETCFVLFFKKLAEHVGEDSNIIYERLLKGPTFGELLSIMDELWEVDSLVPRATLHSLVSRLLDSYIDRGYIVPVVDKHGIRRFRKGEPYATSDTAFQLLQWLGKDINSCTDMDCIVRSLIGTDRERYDRMEKEIQESLISQFANM